MKLIDFGLSAKFEPNVELRSLVGSAYYIAPEVIRGVHDLRCDLWSLGVLMYVILSGDHPFKSSNKTLLFNKILRGEFQMTNSHWK